jgi:hypothetical protein
MKSKLSYKTTIDFINKINKIKNLKNINKLELKRLIIIYIKLNTLFNYDNDVLNLYLPYILYSNIHMKNNNVEDVIEEYNNI